jgi:hypothetical protein
MAQLVPRTHASVLTERLGSGPTRSANHEASARVRAMGRIKASWAGLSRSGPVIFFSFFPFSVFLSFSFPLDFII